MAEVLVFGAGMAGLAAAAHLAAHDVDVLVVEARGRVGGRVLTLHDPRTPVPVELGAELVHEHAEPVQELVRDAKLALSALDGDWLEKRGRSLVKVDDFDDAIADAMAKLAKHARGADKTFAEALALARLRADAAQRVRAFVEGFHAADTTKVGIHGLTKGGAEGPGRALRVHVGYAALAELLAAKVAGSLRLGSRVRRIRWKQGEVRARLASATGHETELIARAAIVALPLGVLREGDLVFEPAAPPPEALEVGHVAKITLRFRERFWKTHDKAAFFFDPRHCFPTFWTTRPLEAPVIVAWSGGPRSRALLARGEEHAVAQALDDLAATLGIAKRIPHDALETWFLHDWSHDPLALGAYSYPGVGGADAGVAFARPKKGTLFFAGEHTADPPNHGTVQGAMESGTRAAKAALRALRRS